MKKSTTYSTILFSIALLLLSYSVKAQVPGDTIKVRTFHYGSNNRDTLAVFPNGTLSYEKIIMKYSMRCKNGLVSNGTDRNLGCGEWDYSCNTYLVDSSKMEEVLSTQPNYVVSNFTGSSFPYTRKAVYDYYQYTQNKVTLNSMTTDTLYTLNSGLLAANQVIKTEEHSGKSQFIYTAAELTAAGLSAGLVHSLILQVNNSGAKASFLKVRMKHTNLLNMQAGIPETTGFTEVFYSDYVFVSGDNRLVFHTPFSWNGVQNVLIEFSFTNTVAGSPISFLGKAEQDSMGMYTLNNHAVNLGNNGHILLDTNQFSRIKNEVSIAFWAYGDAAQMPLSNSILYSTDNNANNRQLNIHLPHSSNNIYFDCGFAAGGYDRINKIATPTEQAGKWNHWVFTKNATTGVMKIYLNGSVWLSGTGKVKPVTLANMVLGKDINLGSNYKGKINNLAIWNKEVNDSFVNQIMNLPIEDLNANSSNLIAFYPLNEGLGQTVIENKNNKNVMGVNLSWTYDRGDKLTRNFKTSGFRPNLKLARGIYNTTVQLISVMDSIKRNPNTISQYSIISKAGVTPLTNDVVNLIGTSDSLYHATMSKVYNGNYDSLPLIDSIANATEGTLAINNLNYYRRYPFYNEIMSFVTPYGIGLDLGINGKSWYYDVTDFAPLLKGNKRILMTLGGQTQEQNDIEFWFVVGTPTRNVLEFNQIWQGTNRTGSASLNSIYNNTRYPATNVPLLSAGKSFKMRSSITGHGAEGEFEANGGQVYHMLNLNGGDTDLVWTISQLCAGNPVFPQGGTWVYDRQGWCPGQSSLLKEQDITGKVTPGSSLSIDYIASEPPKAGGAYNYQVAHQLVTYGAPNFNTDARIMEVVQPSDKILYGRSNPVCAQPKIVVQNSGANAITKLEINYWINNAAVKQNYTWTGNLASMKSDTVVLPIAALWNNGMLTNNNQFFAEIVKVNNVADDYLLNNKFASSFAKPVVIPSVFTLEIRTNNNPTENSFRLEDADGNLVDSKDFTTANSTFSKAYNLGGCYKLIVTDKGEDGLSWWANSSQGTGYARLKNGSGAIIRTFQPDFGKGFEFSFTTNWMLSQEELSLGAQINLYPNPAKDKFILEGKELGQSEVTISDLIGKEMELPQSRKADKIEFNTSALNKGVYLIVIRKNGEQTSKKLVIE